MLVTRQLTAPINFHCREEKYYLSQATILTLFVFNRRNSYRFGTTLGWVNWQICIFGWTISYYLWIHW